MLRRFAPIYMGGFPGANATFTLAQALTIAQNYDVVAAYWGSFQPYVAQMKAANPHLELLAYVNATFAALSHGYPSSWFAHDAQGNLVSASLFPGTDMMDVSNSAWRANVAQVCATLRAQSGYDGCFLDVLGPAPMSPGYASAPPIDPSTGQPWTAASYLAQTRQIALAVQAALPTIPIVGNAIINGANYYDPIAPTAPLGTAVTDGMAEAWFRAASMGPTQYRPESKWIEDVNMIRDSEAAGHPVVVTVKLWQPATAAQIDSVHTFSLASFLMATSGQSIYSFSTGNTPSQLFQTWSLDGVNLGTPTAAYTQSGNAFERTFTRGMVLANPSTSSLQVQVPPGYATLAGTPVSTVTLAADTGMLLQTSTASATLAAAVHERGGVAPGFDATADRRIV